MKTTKALYVIDGSGGSAEMMIGDLEQHCPHITAPEPALIIIETDDPDEAAEFLRGLGYFVGNSREDLEKYL